MGCRPSSEVCAGADVLILIASAIGFEFVVARISGSIIKWEGILT